MKIPNNLLHALRDEHSFLLAAHINPDGDALGSCLALAEALLFLGKRVYVYSKDGVPEYYRFMPGYRRCKKVISRPATKNLLVLLDCNSPERASLEGFNFRKSVVIDHHETVAHYGDIRWIEHRAAATGLMVFKLIKALKVPLTKSMATNLYTALAVDTGTFRYSNTSPDALRAGAELVEAGANPGAISEFLYESWKKNRFDLLRQCLDNLELRDGIAMMHVTNEMFRKTNTCEADTENFANYPRMIDSVSISVFIREMEDGRWKVSMRSKGRANVAKIAAENGGGGHRNAAGFRIRSDIKSLKETLFASSRNILRRI